MEDVNRRINMVVTRFDKMRNIWGSRVVVTSSPEDKTMYIECVFDTDMRFGGTDDD